MQSRLHAFLSLALLVVAGCTRKSPPSPPAVMKEVEAARMSEEEFSQSLPKVGGVPGYVGSDSCRQCHEEEFSSWHRSYHRTMTQFASSNSVQANFNNVVLTNETTRFKLSQRDGEYWVRMEHIGAEAVDPTEVRMGLITGSHHMQVFWLSEGHGNMQIGFPFTWLIPEQRWVPRNSTFIRPPDLQHRPEVWNVVCSRCHTTAVEPHANLTARTIETRAAEMGISCEACHGPAGQHVERQRAAAEAGDPKKVTSGEIVHPEKLDPIRAGQVCGFCHSMKWIPESENWREDGFEFRPGDDLNRTTPVIRPKHLAAIDGLAAYLGRNPEILNDFFWPDGMIRVSGREYNGLIESPCYQGGKFSCLSCHSLHQSEPDDQLSARAKANRGNDACLQCHSQFKESAALAAHTHHRPDSSGSECYNCHMPHTTYGVLKAIRSHQISSPRVADDLEHGRPNACNLCHLDKSLDWTANLLAQWYGQEMLTLPAVETNTARVVQIALAGDAGQRALAAWHLSWEPALQTAGRDWQPAILAQLLDDDYAAVRCVAERSLRSFNLVPADYDFTVDPRERELVRNRIWTQWTKGLPAEGFDTRDKVLSFPRDHAKQDIAFEQRLVQRNEKPVRLRE